MNRSEMIELIRGGVVSSGGVWADFGAGSGNFTAALRALLGHEATLYAVDRDPRALSRQHDHASADHIIHADFTQPFTLPLLDGCLLANALHFVPTQRQPGVMRQLVAYLRPGGCFILVEYDPAGCIPFVPYPISRPAFAQLAAGSGLTLPQVVGARRSPSSGNVMVAMAAQRA